MSVLEISSNDLAVVGSIASAIPEPMVVVDRYEVVVAANELFLQLWGFNCADDAIGLTFTDLLQSQADRDNAPSSLSQNDGWSTILVGIKADGQTFDVNISPRKVRESATVPDYQFLTALDVSDPQQMANALLESEQRFKDVTETVSDLIFELDENGVVTYVSQEMPAGNDLALDPKTGMRYTDIIASLAKNKDGQPADTEDLRIFQRREPFTNFRTVFTDAEGETCVWLRSGVPKFDADGTFRGYRIAQCDITNSTAREEALVRSEMRVQGIMDSVPVGIATIDEDGIVESFNPEAENIFGYSSKEMVGQRLSILMPKADQHQNAAEFNLYLTTGEGNFISKEPQERTGRRHNGEEFPMELAITEMGMNGRRTFIGSFSDISEKKATERQYLQSQKMEAVGQLTGGIAHDFNNLLGALALNLELLPTDTEQADYLAELNEFAETLSATISRGASLTQRLLSFSRQQTLETTSLDVNLLCQGLSSLLARTFPAHVQLATHFASGLWIVNADEHQLENALLNLCINARDAMPEGGKLTIETKNHTMTKSTPSLGEDIPPGDYVLINVGDTGTGIPESMLDKIIEPFFTTKDVGKGTGLGLSMVYGFVRQSGGYLTITNKQTEGAMVQLYFPKSLSSRVVATPPRKPRAEPNIKGLSILVVEDDVEIKKVLCEALKRKGYNVYAASSGPEAIELLNTRTTGPDLLLTDIVLPGGMPGNEIAQKICTAFPNCAVIYMSGYLDEEITKFRQTIDRSNFLPKPFTLIQLTEMIKDVLSAEQAA
jgi:PAS domain S-box-containing protein